MTISDFREIERKQKNQMMRCFYCNRLRFSSMTSTLKLLTLGVLVVTAKGLQQQKIVKVFKPSSSFSTARSFYNDQVLKSSRNPIENEPTDKVNVHVADKRRKKKDMLLYKNQEDKIPNLYTRHTILLSRHHPPLAEGSSLPILSTKEVMNRWIEFCWEGNAGLPLPIPPLTFGEKENKVRWIIPPFLKERIISLSSTSLLEDDIDLKYMQGKTNNMETKTSDADNTDMSEQSRTMCEIIYKVDNPGLLTYQVHSHLGRVRFIPIFDEENNAAIDMVWEVEIRPYHYWSTIVKWFTSSIITTYSRNFKCNLLYYEGGPQSTVSLKLPRGGFMGKTILEVRKDSWIGGVLDAHLHDNRTVVKQTIAMFQPWTWGRCSDSIDEGGKWSDGYMQ
mmetsp:Transcript_20141/g.24828  ORF Transcript_20141/g.24828 Transcript_20141/m.24828 type:complete len:391 (+) Transcript_20141:212-1384(+)